MLKDSLLELGFTGIQAKIYLKLLELKQSSVLKLAQEVQIQRPTIYDNLSKLEKLGLVAWVVKGSRRLVQVNNPSLLVQAMTIKQRQAQALLPDLAKLYELNQPTSPQITFFHGKEGYRRLANVIPSAQSSLIQSIGSYQENIRNGFNEKFLKELWEARSRRHIRAQVLFTESDRKLLVQNRAYNEIGNIRYNREVRILPKSIQLQVLYTLVDDKVLFWSANTENFALLFQSESYANSLRTIFDFLWSISTIYH